MLEQKIIKKNKNAVSINACSKVSVAINIMNELVVGSGCNKLIVQMLVHLFAMYHVRKEDTLIKHFQNNLVHDYKFPHKTSSRFIWFTRTSQL